MSTLQDMPAIDQQAVQFLQPYVDKMAVTLTYAQSLDGCIGVRERTKPLVMSCPQSFRVTHTLRRYHDYILVGAGTVSTDDPGLNARDGHNNAVPLSRQPVPVFLDLQGRCLVTKDAKVCKNARRSQGLPALRIVHRALFEARQRRLFPDSDMQAAYQQLEAGGVESVFLTDADVTVHGDGQATVAWTDIIACLRARDPFKQSVMIEGGAAVIRSVLTEGVASLCVVTVAPSYIGEKGVSLDLKEAVGMTGVTTGVFGRDAIICGMERSSPD